MNFVKFNGSNTDLSLSGNNTITNFLKSISKIDTTTLIIVISVILLIIAAIFYYYFYVLPKMKTSYSSNKTEGFDNNKEAELLFFFADWCPHCKTAKPVWEELKSKYENQTINGYKVQFSEINCTTESEDVEKMMNKYNIEGFPTFKLLKDGQIVEYDAKPTKETLNEFLNTVL